ncbi:MAG: endolytic transglycosylase MltG [Betaproteobacteria bacterium]|nr:endolytic transglycosylase MltG [Betaproteobacteria bacterium]
MTKRVERILRVLFGASVAAIIITAGAFTYYAAGEIEIGPTPVQFSLRKGSSLRSAAQQMEGAGMLQHPALFIAMARMLGEAGNIKAGIYEVSGRVSPYQLLLKITEGDVTQATITFVEGWTFRQMRKLLDEHPAVKHDTRGLPDADILKRLAIEIASPEGLFFPDTFHFDVGSSDVLILRRAYRQMQSHLEAQWAGRAPDLPLASPYEALILASIVEKETGQGDDRPLVAAVFVNRLRKGMLLQADPTVIYGMGEAFDGNLRKRDLTTDTPYNTYTRTGLPPTPIAMPGLSSLAVTLNPPASNVLYFVAKGDGSSHFSSTLGEHERAVTKYQRSGRR